MKNYVPKDLQKGRVRHGLYGSRDEDGLMGAFFVKGPGRIRHTLQIISSGSHETEEWEHVSVSIKGKNLTPSWEEMDFVKRLFWHDDETVMQLHVPRQDHVNQHEHTLHLWRPVGVEVPRPDAWLVGVPNTSSSMAAR